MSDQLTIDNVSKIFSKNNLNVIALNQINFTLNKGDSISITGESGTGKTTLLNILSLIIKPTTGNIIFKGEDLSLLNSKDKERFRFNNIGYIYQDFLLLDNKTVFDNIKIPLMYLKPKVSFKELNDRVNSALSKIGMLEFKNRKILELSGGEKQRIAICRALINNPEIILADEPTGSLDGFNRNLILKYLFDFIGNDKFLIITTHDKYVKNLCKKNITLSKIEKL